MYVLLWGGGLAGAAERYVAAPGRIVPGDGLVTVAAPVLGGEAPVVQALFVREGETITPGQKIATLAGAQVVEATIEAAEAKLPVLQSAVNVAEERLDALEAKLEATKAQLPVIESEKRAAEREIRVIRAEEQRELAAIEAQRQRLQGEINENERILRDEILPNRDEGEIRFQLKMLRLEKIRVSAARPQLSNVFDARIAAAQSQVRVADAKIAQMQREISALRAEKDVLSAQIEQAKEEIPAAEADIGKARARLARYTVNAPMAGQVYKVRARAGESAANGIVLMGNHEDLNVRAEVYIDDIRFVEEGQSAIISSDAFAETLSGEVSAITLIERNGLMFATDPTSFTDRRVVEVRIDLVDEVDFPLFINSKVTVRIAVED